MRDKLIFGGIVLFLAVGASLGSHARLDYDARVFAGLSPVLPTPSAQYPPCRSRSDDRCIQLPAQARAPVARARLAYARLLEEPGAAPPARRSRARPQRPPRTPASAPYQRPEDPIGL